MAEEKKNPLFGAFRTTDPPKAANPTTPPPVGFTPVATKKDHSDFLFLLITGMVNAPFPPKHR